MINVLICTIDSGIAKVPHIILPPTPGVSWVVSMQWTDRKFLELVPKELAEREDVTFTTIEGKGLSRNRNNALDHAKGEIIVIADDDCIYTGEQLTKIETVYDTHPDADGVCFMAESLQGELMRHYPTDVMTLADAQSRGYYLSSFEMTFRRSSLLRTGVRFDERFGLGSDMFGAGEEDILMKDFTDKGARVLFVPEVIVRTEEITTGTHFTESANLQVTKGAVFRYVFGVSDAIWRSFKEGMWHLVHSHINPVSIIYNMLRGIWMLR